MNHVLPSAVLLCLAGLLTAAAADETPFALITQRNIFDPTRRPDAPREEREVKPPAPAPVRSESILLTGSLVSPEKKIAFFSGSDPAYNAIRKPEEQIGDFTLRDVTTTQVVLQQEETELVLPVGHQLQRTGDQPWAVTARAPVPAATPSSPAPAASQEMSDVMKRLLERRQKELSK